MRGGGVVVNIYVCIRKKGNDSTSVCKSDHEKNAKLERIVSKKKR